MLQIIINPTAGNGRAERVGAQIVELLSARGIAHEAALTQAVGHATELSRSAAERGVDTVVAIGGDGTLCEVMRGLAGTRTALGIIPAGTGNDVIKMLGLPDKPMDALDFILTHPARKLDAGKLNDIFFLNVCGTGFDVCVLEYAKSAKKYMRGIFPYLWGVIRTIFTYKPLIITFEVDGWEAQTKPLLIISIANGRFIGGGMEVAPDAKPDDGLFDLITIDNMPRRKLPQQLPKLLSGRVMDIPGARRQQCRRVTVSAKDMHVNVDGEILPMDKAVFEIQPDTLLAHW